LFRQETKNIQALVKQQFDATQVIKRILDKRRDASTQTEAKTFSKDGKGLTRISNNMGTQTEDLRTPTRNVGTQTEAKIFSKDGKELTRISNNVGTQTEDLRPPTKNASTQTEDEIFSKDGKKLTRISNNMGTQTEDLRPPTKNASTQTEAKNFSPDGKVVREKELLDLSPQEWAALASEQKAKIEKEFFKNGSLNRK
jgi:hypothetical protein